MIALLVIFLSAPPRLFISLKLMTVLPWMGFGLFASAANKALSRSSDLRSLSSCTFISTDHLCCIFLNAFIWAFKYAFCSIGSVGMLESVKSELMELSSSSLSAVDGSFTVGPVPLSDAAGLKACEGSTVICFSSSLARASFSLFFALAAFFWLANSFFLLF